MLCYNKTKERNYLKKNTAVSIATSLESGKNGVIRPNHENDVQLIHSIFRTICGFEDRQCGGPHGEVTR